MKKLLFSALACVAFAGSGFASNEIIVDLPSVPEEKVDSTVINSKDDKTENGVSAIECNTTLYGRYLTQIVNEGIGMDGQYHYSTTTVYKIVGGCETCYHLNGTVTKCWGFGWD